MKQFFAMHSSKRLQAMTSIPRRGAVIGAVLWVWIVCGIAFFLGLADTGLVDETEPLFAEAARQMTETGDWVTPYFNGITRFDKPPLVYWLMAIAFRLFGVSEWAVRLPSALSATALVGLGFYTLQRFGFSRPELIKPDRVGAANPGPKPRSPLGLPPLWWSAAISSAIMALHPETLVWARIGVSDMLLTGCIGTALFAFFMGYAQPGHRHRQRGWFLACIGLMGLAVLAKGPVGVVLPGAIIGAFLLYVGQLRAVLREWPLVQGSVLFLGITLPWYILVVAANGQSYIDSFFGYHNVERFTRVVNGHGAPWYFYFLVVAIGFLPWSPFLPLEIARLRPWKRRYWQRQPRSAQLSLFALVWLVVIFSFFTVAVTKLPSYVLPLMPAAAILVGLTWSDRLVLPRSSPQPEIGFWLSYGLTLVIFAVLLWAALYSPNWMGNDPTMAGLPELVRDAGVMVRAAIIWGIAIVVGLVLLCLRRSQWLWGVNLIAFAAFLIGSILPAYQLADQVRQLPLRAIAQTIVAEKRSDETVYMTGFMKPSLVYYSQQPVTYIEDPTELRQQLSAQPNQSALVVGTPEELTQLGSPGAEITLLEHIRNYQLIRVGARP